MAMRATTSGFDATLGPSTKKVALDLVFASSFSNLVVCGPGPSSKVSAMHLSFEQSGCSPGAAVVVGCAVIDAEALFEAVADGLAAGEEDVVGSGVGSSDGEADVVGDPLGVAGALSLIHI